MFAGHQRASSRVHRAALSLLLGFQNRPRNRLLSLCGPIVRPLPPALSPPLTPRSWALGAGHAVLIDHYGPSFPVTAKTHAVLLSPAQGRTAWIAERGCIWEEHGVWAWDPKRGEVGEPVALRCDYFTKDPVTGREVDWYKCVGAGDRGRRRKLIGFVAGTFIGRFARSLGNGSARSTRIGTLSLGPFRMRCVSCVGEGERAGS